MYVVEYIPNPTNLGWTGVETVACVAGHSALVDFFEKELELSIDPALTGDIEDILEAREWPEFTAHYRISALSKGKHVREFVDQ